MGAVLPVNLPGLAGNDLLRLGIFVATLFAMALWERSAPRRVPDFPRVGRWRSNLGLGLSNALLVRVLPGLSAVAVAGWCEREGFGLLQRLGAPAAVAIPLAVAVLDLGIWAQHVVFHRVPLLWRLHRVHHTDPDFDPTTATRFHPVEIAISMGVKMAIVAALGAAPGAVVAFEVLLSTTALFNHGNVRLPLALDRRLRLWLVTPDMHRVHHSVVREETDSNYGFNLPWWDRLFGTYRAQPLHGHEGMVLGQSAYRDERSLRFGWLLAHPFASGREERGQGG